uniref:hypothetical protein n=1 Tax=Methylobacterium sp. TaxID=409 RepID=UPI0020C89899|nr:hypothetical protein [Methylobacterium sp.]USU34645.1 hypothetical protein NG677_24005 [Methylobacterium sp.]
MSPDDDPLWYDRAEPDEPLGFLAMVLIGTFAVLEFLWAGSAALARLLKGGAAVALRDPER